MLNPITTPNTAKRAIIATFLCKAKKLKNEDLDNEVNHIYHVADMIGLPHEDVMDLLKDESLQCQGFLDDEMDRLMILFSYLFFVRKEGVYCTEEVRQVKGFGLSLGFRPDLIEDFMLYLSRHPYESVQPESLLKMIAVYHN